MISASSISHKVKRFRSMALIIVTLVVMFYYTFLNEEYSMNQHLDDEELPRVTNNHGGIVPFEGLLEKNKYYPLVALEQARSKTKLVLPDEYLNNQKSTNLRKKKKQYHYKIGKENYFKLPKISKSDGYPMIQSSYFKDGGLKDEEKLKRISDAFDLSWKTYTTYGYGHDEVLPLSHTPEDPFNGWAATLVDSLDTMKLMHKDDEFKKAVKFISKMNFKQSYREDIPLFENTIRILAGLISGYEFSKEKILLEKAKDLAELLMEAFDTPNNMPLLYYEWKNQIQNRYASKEGALAEFGSLSLEFSRLSQLTKDNKYFDAITRITNKLNDSYNEGFYIPGLYSNKLDISGCQLLTEDEIDKGLHLNNPKVIKSIKDNEFVYCLLTEKVFPVSKQIYTIGGLADSFYEYLPKMFHLLRGDSKFSPTYKEMYLRAIDKIKEFMIFKPKIPDNENILFISSFLTTPKLEIPGEEHVLLHQELEMQHLSCFAGGMIALGSRLFDIPEDLELAGNVTYGCVAMYDRLKIMPEIVFVDKQLDKDDVYTEEKRLKEVELAKSSKSNGEVDTTVKKPAAKPPSNKGKPLKAEDKPKEYDLNDEEPEVNVGIVKEGEKLKAATEKANKALLNDKRDRVSDFEKSRPKAVKSLSSKKQPLNFQEVPKKIVEPKEPWVFPPYHLNAAGEKVWKIGDTENQPIWANKLESKYILRPEAIESVLYMYRITGDSKWREYGWMMWENVEKYAKTEDGEFAGVFDLTNLGGENNFMDVLESFWFSETLKYFYLLFEDVSVWSFDDYVFNTEAHPFRLD